MCTSTQRVAALKPSLDPKSQATLSSKDIVALTNWICVGSVDESAGLVFAPTVLRPIHPKYDSVNW